MRTYCAAQGTLFNTVMSYMGKESERVDPCTCLTNSLYCTTETTL